MESNNKVVEVIDALCEKFGIAINWADQNVRPYIQDLVNRFIKFEIATSIFWMCLWPLLTLIAFRVAKHFYKQSDKDDWDDETFSWWANLWSWIIFGIFSFVSIIVVGVQIMDIITCLTLPEKAVLDYLTETLGTC